MKYKELLEQLRTLTQDQLELENSSVYKGSGEIRES